MFGIHRPNIRPMSPLCGAHWENSSTLSGNIMGNTPLSDFSLLPQNGARTVDSTVFLFSYFSTSKIYDQAFQVTGVYVKSTKIGFLGTQL